MNRHRQPLSPDQAMKRAAALCARSEQAPGDIRSKLIDWGINATDASRIVKSLIEQGFLDESRFAKAFVKDKFTFNGWGKTKLAYQLRLKGIPAEVIDEAMNVIADEQYRDRLVGLLRAKWQSVREREPRAARAAMMRFASSRGFETGIAAECVKQVTKTDVQED